MKKIYPFDWQVMHPNKMSASTDRYYADIANKVQKILCNCDLTETFYEDENIRDASLRLTAWFEDVCSGFGFWRLAGRETNALGYCSVVERRPFHQPRESGNCICRGYDF